LSSLSNAVHVVPPGGPDAARNREFLQFEVERQRVGAVAGAALAAHDAVAVAVTDASGGRLASLQTATAAAAAYDAVLAAQAADGASTVTVDDGRLLFGGAA